MTLIFIVTCALFAFSIDIRKHRIAEHLQGHLSHGHHQWITAHAIQYTNSWRISGAFAERFASLHQPPSVEFPTLQSRGPHLSYPPGTMLPLYLLAQLGGQKATPGMAVLYNLGNQFAVALLIACALFFVLLRLRFHIATAAVLSAAAPAFFLFNAAAMYFYTSTFWSDQAVLLPFVAFVFLEVLRDDFRSHRARNTIAWLQAALMFYGVLTDYLFLCVAAVVYLLRVMQRRRGILDFIKTGALFWSPAALASTLYLWQLHAFGWLQLLYEKALVRMAVTDKSATVHADFFQTYWHGTIAHYYGEAAVWILWGGLIALPVLALPSFIARLQNAPASNKSPDALRVIAVAMALFVAPCFLQLYLLRDHSTVHSFSALKFAIPLSVIIVLLPVAIAAVAARIGGALFRLPAFASFARYNAKIFIAAQTILAALLLASAMSVVTTAHRDEMLKGFPPIAPQLKSVGDFIQRHTDYADVIFSPVHQVNAGNGIAPQAVSLTMKRIYPAHNTADIKRVVAAIRDDFRVNVFLNAGQSLADFPGLQTLQSLNPKALRDDSYVLYQMPGREFLSKF